MARIVAHAGIIFALVRKSLRNGKKTTAYLKKLLRNYAQSWDHTFRKTKLDPDIQIYATFFWAITDIVTVAIKTFQLKYANMFCFYFREVFPRVYLTKQHNYFTKRKSLRTCLFVENQWKHVTLYSVIYQILSVLYRIVFTTL